MNTDLGEWASRFRQVASLTDRKYIVIVNEDDYWPMAARLLHTPQITVKSSPFVKKGAGYVIPDPEDYRPSLSEVGMKF